MIKVMSKEKKTKKKGKKIKNDIFTKSAHRCYLINYILDDVKKILLLLLSNKPSRIII